MFIYQTSTDVSNFQKEKGQNITLCQMKYKNIGPTITYIRRVQNQINRKTLFYLHNVILA